MSLNLIFLIFSQKKQIIIVNYSHFILSLIVSTINQPTLHIKVTESFAGYEISSLLGTKLPQSIPS